jgi:hypothetical protein
VTFFNVQGQEKTEVMLLGTYHFGNTSDKLKVIDNILREEKQKELKVLLGKLKKFKPEKIYVENEPNQQHFWDSIYKSHQEIKEIVIKSELYQIGIKLASLLKLKSGVTCVDWHIKPANTFAEKQYEILFDSMLKYDDSIDANVSSEQKISEFEKQTMVKIRELYEKTPEMKIINAYKIYNSEKHLERMFYGNIASYLEVDEYHTNIFWSQNDMIRNVNIYQNIIQDILKDNPKKVIILYGAGHIKALRNYLEVHPKIKIVDTIKYLD